MKINLPNTLDQELLRGPGEEYFPAWLKKHRPTMVDADPRGVELEAIDCEKERVTRYANMRQRKRAGMRQAVKI